MTNNRRPRRSRLRELIPRRPREAEDAQALERPETPGAQLDMPRLREAVEQIIERRLGPNGGRAGNQ